MAIFSPFWCKKITPKLKKISYRSDRNQKRKKGVIFAMKITPKILPISIDIKDALSFG